MIRRLNRLVVASKCMATTLDGHLPFGAAFSCERRFRTGLPVLSDLIRTMGSASVPTRIIVPPLGPLTDARLPPLPVITPKVRLPW